MDSPSPFNLINVKKENTIDKSLKKIDKSNPIIMNSKLFHQKKVKRIENSKYVVTETRK